MLNLKILNLKYLRFQELTHLLMYFFARKAFDANIANFVYLRKKTTKSNDSNLPE